MPVSQINFLLGVTMISVCWISISSLKLSLPVSAPNENTSSYFQRIQGLLLICFALSIFSSGRSDSWTILLTRVYCLRLHSLSLQSAYCNLKRLTSCLLLFLAILSLGPFSLSFLSFLESEYLLMMLVLILSILSDLFSSISSKICLLSCLFSRSYSLRRLCMLIIWATSGLAALSMYFSIFIIKINLLPRNMAGITDSPFEIFVFGGGSGVIVFVWG